MLMWPGRSTVRGRMLETADAADPRTSLNAGPVGTRHVGQQKRERAVNAAPGAW